MARTKIDWMPILLEAFFVVFGVVLAFGVNEWREQQEQQRDADAALASILSELRLNHDAIVEAATYHGELMNTLRSFRPASGGEGPQYPDHAVFAGGYTRPAELISTAWNAANATDLVGFMHYDDVLRLAHIYQQQEDYHEQTLLVGQNLYTKLFNEGHEAVRRNYANLINLISAYLYTECNLIDDYSAILAHFAGTPPDSSEAPPICAYMPRR